MAKLPPLARTVAVGSTWYKAGDTPPLHHARKITNPKNWPDGVVPDFDETPQPKDPSTGRTPPDTSDSGPPAPDRDTDTGSEGAGTGNETGDGETGETPNADPPTKPAKKAAPAKATN